jgi:hypothetical protein
MSVKYGHELSGLNWLRLEAVVFFLNYEISGSLSRDLV